MAEGLTICIAAYRYNARPLLESLSPALEKTAWPVEVFLGDDASGSEWAALYDTLSQEFSCTVLRPAHNLGRAGIRNRMATEAKFDWLLFLDVDSLIVDAGFLLNYIQLAVSADVVAGGTLYTSGQAGAGTLRHRYGLKREMIPAHFRHQNPYARLALNNLFIRKEVFEAAGSLDETITNYGHEDTLLGRGLERLNAGILHIANPVLHTGLEADAIFLAKSLEAARGLANLYKTGKLSQDDARLILVAERLRKVWLAWLPGVLAPLFPNTSLRGLDLRKLAAFLDAMKG